MYKFQHEINKGTCNVSSNASTVPDWCGEEGVKPEGEALSQFIFQPLSMVTLRNRVLTPGIQK